MSPAPTDDAQPRPTRAGYVALLGRPNAGKSTLLNAFLGEKLSIVTPKAQTTWKRVTGILTDEEAGAQMVFLDTPGLLEVRDRLQASMLEEAHEALRDSDVLVLVLDASRFRVERDGPVLTELFSEGEGIRRDLPVLVALNKVDEAPGGAVEALASWAGTHLPGPVHRISALKGTGVRGLLAAIQAALPESPFFFPEDEIATEPVKFFVSELIRETVFEQFRQEIPYSVACEVGEFRESEDPVYIQATLFVDRPPQKRILIGEKGSAIRELGKAARLKIQEFIQRPVYLDLWVKVLPGWRRKPGDLKRLGYRVPEEDRHAHR